MLIKVNGVLMSAAPAEGESGGSSGGESESASADTGGQESGGESGGEEGGGESGSAEQDTGDGQGDLGGDFDFDAFLSYDPFGESPSNSGKPSKTGDEGEGHEKDPKAAQGERQTGQGEQKPAEGKGQEPGQKEKTNPEMELLRDQVQQLTQLLNQQQQTAQQAAAAKEPAGEQTPEAKQKAWHEAVAKTLPGYQFNVPDTVMQKMGSDDPNQIKAGLAEFAQGVAQVTHYNVSMQMEERLEALEQKLLEKSVSTFKETTKAEQQEQETKSKVFKDFYGAFPELNKPELQLFVQTQAKMLAQQYGVNQWNEKFRDALGEHVKKVLGITSQGPQPNADGSQGNGQKKPGQRFNAGSGAGRSNKGSSDVDDIADTLLG